MSQRQSKRAEEPRRVTYLSLTLTIRRAAKARAALLGVTTADYVARLVADDIAGAGMGELLGAEDASWRSKGAED